MLDQKRYVTIALLLIGLSGSVAGSERGHLLVRLENFPVGNPAEVSVAINPKDPTNLIATSLVTGLKPRSASYAYVSTDQGRSWNAQEMANPENRTQGDDAVRFDRSGRAFRSYISFRGLRVKQPHQPLNGIFVTQSPDQGKSWTEPVAVVDHRNSITPFEDKPYLSIDTLPTSNYLGTIYIAWTRFDRYGSDDPEDQSHIYISRSTNNGRTFSSPIRISDTGGDCLDGDGTVEGAVPAIGIDGEVYVVWSGPQGLVLDRSVDGGETFQKDRLITRTPGGWDLQISGLRRANGLPVTGVDKSPGPRRGTLYVNWVDERHGDPDVFLIKSEDRGDTWSEPIRIHTDAVGNGRPQFFTWMAVDPIDGSVNVLFFDRSKGNGTDTSVTLARSVDGGETFLNLDVGLAPFQCRTSPFFGDYNGIDAFGGLVVGAFPHFIGPSRLGLSAAVFKFEPGTLRHSR